jgi:hypothetical protein
MKRPYNAIWLRKHTLEKDIDREMFGKNYF